MVIALVADQFDSLNNGTTASARRFVENLRSLGHTVRVLTSSTPGPDKYILPLWHIPIVSWFADKQGMTFCKIDKKVIREFLTDADVVHFYFPFPLARAVEKMAREMNIPCIAAFHVQPENITYQIKLGWSKLAADFFYHMLRIYFFNRFDDIHCPTEFIAGELRKHGYKAKLHVISNGIDAKFTPGEKKPHDKFRIAMSGRFSPEKRQDLLIAAAKLSKHKNDIQLMFMGRGPSEEYYKSLAADLPNPASFKFYYENELIETLRNCDLYVHTSDVEIEAIACMEAFACGLVPIISNSPKSATPHFALDARSLFKHGNAEDLANKIDYWIDHPEERAEMSKRYIAQGESLRVINSVKQIENVYKGLKPKHS